MATQVSAISFPTGSRWVHAYMLTCANQLAIWYKHSKTGVPSVVCLYPKVNGPAYYAAMKAWNSKGKFVHEVLPYREPYQIIAPPQAPYSNQCCCASSGTCQACSQCSQKARNWGLTVAGFAGPPASCGCTALNGCWVLVPQGADCTWQAGSGSQLVQLTFAGGQWLLKLTLTAGTLCPSFTYQLTSDGGGTFLCCGPNTFLYSSQTGNGECTAWPASLTINPCDCAC